MTSVLAKASDLLKKGRATLENAGAERWFSLALPTRTHWQKSVPVGLFYPVASGLLLILVFVFGFGIWAVSAPISGAVVASGVIQASGANQLIDHLEGGIIAKINVREGDAVNAGQLLMLLDETHLLTERNRARAALIFAKAKIARAMAERDGASKLEFPEDVEEDARTAGLEFILDQERAEFRNGLERHLSDLAILEQRTRATEEELEGLDIQITSEQRKLEVTRQELADKESLLDQGLTSRGQVNSLQRAEADSLGRIGSLKASLGQKRSAKAELLEQISGLAAERRETASAEVNATRTQISDYREQLNSRAAVLERSQIRAPTDGIVVNIAKNTVGSVVRPGEPVMEILPTSRELIIDARVMPTDVDTVKPGQEANLRFTALNVRTTPEVPAVVTYLSADRLVDKATQESYYRARLEMSSDLPREIDPGQIYPGMPVEAFIKTGDRTFMEYLMRPIQDSFSKAFREE